MKIILIIMLGLAASGCNTNNVKPDTNISETYMKGESAYARKDYKQAKLHFEKVIIAYPDNIESLFKLANINMRNKNWDAAQTYYSAVIQLKPNHAKAHHNLAMLHLFKAKNHLNYYIANNESFDNKKLGILLNSINAYSSNSKSALTPLDRLADAVKTHKN